MLITIPSRADISLYHSIIHNLSLGAWITPGFNILFITLRAPYFDDDSLYELALLHAIIVITILFYAFISSRHSIIY